METLIKKLNNLSLRKYFVVSVLATLVIIVLLSLFTIWGCMSFRKYLLPDSNNVFLKVYRTYEDGSEVSYSVRVKVGEEGAELPVITADDKAAKKSKKSRFKADKKQDALNEKIAELEDKVKRQMAEFDNFRKRTDKEKNAMFETGAKSVIEKILPVVDNFERGLATIPEDDKATPVAEGMDKIYRQLTKVLEDVGVKEIDACGKEFNPDYHNAVMHVEDENFGENEVAEEFQKGYMYRDSVVRHSMVKVAN